MLRRVVAATQIPIFDRVHQIALNYRDLRQIPLVKDDVARLSKLERISIKKNGSGAITEADVQVAEDLVPPCRLVSVSKTASQIEMQIHAGLACAPSPLDSWSVLQVRNEH